MSQQIKHLNEDNVRTILKWINLSASIDKSIDDLNIRTDAVFSSKKVSELTQDVKHSLEQYIQSSINGLTHLKKKIVDTLPSDADAEENILYLVKDTSVVDGVVYNQYLLIDGVLEPLGSTNTDLSNYYNKDESDAKFALLSNLQTLIDMVGNVSDLETTAKDTLVSAINEIKEGLDNCVTKDAIVTTLDDTVTDEQVPSAKAVYDNAIKNHNLKTYTKLEQLGLTAPITVGEIFNAMPYKTMAVIACEDIADHITDVPTSYGVLTIKKNYNARFSIEYQNSLQGSPCNVKRWIGTLKGSDGTGLYWKQLSAEPTFVTLNDIGLTADATFQDVIDALPTGGSALLGVKDFTNYQTIFPYEEGNDQFARVYIVKGIEDGSCMYARWFRKDGSKEAIAIFNKNDNKFSGWQEIATMDKVKALHKETTGYITGSLLGSVVKDANLYYKKFGDNRLVINGWVSVDAVSAGTPIFTLPNNWKVNSNYLIPCYVIGSNVACACIIDINDGTVNSYTPLPATLELRFCGEIYLM